MEELKFRFLGSRDRGPTSVRRRECELRAVPSVTYPAPVYDLKAAVRWLRANAADYGLDPDRIATGGASSGRHLASLGDPSAFPAR